MNAHNIKAFKIQKNYQLRNLVWLATKFSDLKLPVQNDKRCGKLQNRSWKRKCKFDHLCYTWLTLESKETTLRKKCKVPSKAMQEECPIPTSTKWLHTHSHQNWKKSKLFCYIGVTLFFSYIKLLKSFFQLKIEQCKNTTQ